MHVINPLFWTWRKVFKFYKRESVSSHFNEIHVVYLNNSKQWFEWVLNYQLHKMQSQLLFFQLIMGENPFSGMSLVRPSKVSKIPWCCSVQWALLCLEVLHGRWTERVSHPLAGPGLKGFNCRLQFQMVLWVLTWLLRGAVTCFSGRLGRLILDLPKFFFFFKKIIYLSSLQHAGSLVVACEALVAECGV